MIVVLFDQIEPAQAGVRRMRFERDAVLTHWRLMASRLKAVQADADLHWARDLYGNAGKETQTLCTALAALNTAFAPDGRC